MEKVVQETREGMAAMIRDGGEVRGMVRIMVVVMMKREVVLETWEGRASVIIFWGGGEGTRGVMVREVVEKSRESLV